MSSTSALKGSSGSQPKPSFLRKNHSVHRFTVGFSGSELEPILDGISEEEAATAAAAAAAGSPATTARDRANSAPHGPFLISTKPAEDKDDKPEKLNNGGVVTIPFKTRRQSLAGTAGIRRVPSQASLEEWNESGDLHLAKVESTSSVLSAIARTALARRRSTILTYTSVPIRYWINEPLAREYVLRLFTCFYALFIIILGVIIELSNVIAYGTEQVAHLKDLLYDIWMYGMSCVVICFCGIHIYMEYRRLKHIRRAMARMLMVDEPEPEMLSNPSTGSLYMRVGCVVFGIIGVVYYTLMGMGCAFDWEGHTANECSAAGILISFVAAAFVFLQMWFVYCNGKIAINGRAKYFIQFGLMHLVATNLWLWIRYILYEEARTIKEIRAAHFGNASELASLSLLPFQQVSTETLNASLDHLPLVLSAPAHSHSSAHECIGIQCIFGEFSEFMNTCVVEFSLICAGVAYVFWTNIHGEKQEVKTTRRRLRKRNVIQIDCSRTAEGLFAGFIFLIATVISVALFNVYSAHDTHMAQGIFLSTSMIFYSLAIFACLGAFWKMKVLAFNNEPDSEYESAELLDEILLVVGLIGELVYCIGGILAFINNRQRLSISLMLLLLNLLRLIQVSLQSGLLMLGSRLGLDTENPKTVRHKPGKQIITLLLIVNIALFLMNIFEGEKAGVTDEIVQLYGSRSWALVVRGCSPLTIFFRFHSSVCFAEIWKRSFKQHHRGSSGLRLHV